jgi:FAD/FMN-containing dehydrogenase
MTADFEVLRGQLTGTIATPGQPGYELAEPWNRAVPVTPAAVVAVADADDVAHTVRFAAEHGLRVAVQITGHGAVPLGDDVLLVHTAKLDECVVDAERRVARIGAGVVWQQVVDAAAPHGLAPLSGSAPHVGVVGYLTGGGIGPLAATFGVSSDYVRAFDVVAGEGQVRHVTATEHPDLFWGLRGGKATLGIVTAVEVELLPLASVYGGSFFFDGSESAAVLHAWASWSADLPDHATTSAVLVELPNSPRLPPAIAGKRLIAVRYASVADEQQAEEAFMPLRGVATPLLGGIGEIPAAEIGSIHADPTDAMPYQEYSVLLDSLPSDAVDALLAVAGPGSGSPLVVELRRLGGAIAKDAAHPSAVSHRDAAYSVGLVGRTSPESGDAVAGVAARTLAALEGWSSGGRMVNFGASADPAEIARAYDAETLQRLGALARQYDPKGTLAVGQVVR